MSLKYYHCSNNDFEKFENYNNIGYKEIDLPMWFFTKNKKYAKTYGKILYTVEISIKESKILDLSKEKEKENFLKYLDKEGINKNEILDEQFYILPYWTCYESYYYAFIKGFEGILISEELYKEEISLCIFDKEKIKIIDKKL